MARTRETFLGQEIERVATRYGCMMIPSRDTVIGRSLKLYGEWAQNEIDFLATFLEDEGVILDVGANLGTHSMALSSRFRNATVIAFEPQPFLFALLTTNLLGLPNGGDRRALNAACGSSVEILKISADVEAVGGNFGALRIDQPHKSANQFFTPIPIIPIDSLVFPSRIQLIKIDVEGMEESVLKGAWNSISRDGPVIFFEVLTVEALRSCRNVLLDLGYRMFWVETSAFNQANYIGSKENIWGLGETAVVAIRGEVPAQILSLDEVSGLEVTVPREKYRHY